MKHEITTTVRDGYEAGQLAVYAYQCTCGHFAGTANTYDQARAWAEEHFANTLLDSE